MAKTLSCNTCTRQLVYLACKRSFWFGFFRQPLKIGMRLWVFLARIDLDGYILSTPACRDCNRFYKNALKDNSPLFRKLNDIVNPCFDRAIENILGKRAISEARERAKNRDFAGTPEDLDSWTRI